MENFRNIDGVRVVPCGCRQKYQENDEHHTKLMRLANWSVLKSPNSLVGLRHVCNISKSACVHFITLNAERKATAVLAVLLYR
jgi:hypothetical protein